MSIHPSLNISDKDKKQRSVMKRIERIKSMLEKNLWKDGDNVFGLPKLKSTRIKIKKEKVEKVAEGAAGAAAATPAAGGKETAAKGAGAKGAEKK